MERSFLSSTVTRWSVSVLKTEKISWPVSQYTWIWMWVWVGYHDFEGGVCERDADINGRAPIDRFP